MSSSGPRRTFASTLTRRGATPAAITAAGVFAAMLLGGVLTALLSSVSSTSLALGFDAGYLGSVWSEQLRLSLVTLLPFAVGVFLSLWQLAPIGPELRLAHVVTRALLAAAIGAACVIVVVVLLGALGAVVGLPGAIWGGPSTLGTAVESLGFRVLDGVLGALRTLVAEATTVVLACVLLWGWLQRHPLAHDVAGRVDEV